MDKEEDKKTHGFCVNPNSGCTMSYCDDNGCNERKRCGESEECQDNVGTVKDIDSGNG